MSELGYATSAAWIQMLNVFSVRHKKNKQNMKLS